MNILEEFWYGNIDHAEYDSSLNKEYKEMLQRISRNEWLLMVMLYKIGFSKLYMLLELSFI